MTTFGRPGDGVAVAFPSFIWPNFFIFIDTMEISYWHGCPYDLPRIFLKDVTKQGENEPFYCIPFLCNWKSFIFEKPCRKITSRVSPLYLEGLESQQSTKVGRLVGGWNPQRWWRETVGLSTGLEAWPVHLILRQNDEAEWMEISVVSS